MENDRTRTARDNDDSTIIDRAAQGGTGGESGREGGNLQRDVGTQDQQARATDPDAHTRVTKEDDIAHGERQEVDRARG